MLVRLQVGIGPNSNYSELRSMASAPESSNVIMTRDFSALTDDLVFRISSLVCRSTYSVDAASVQSPSVKTFTYR